MMVGDRGPKAPQLYVAVLRNIKEFQTYAITHLYWLPGDFVNIGSAGS